MRSRRNHLDALKSRPNRKHLPHWSIDWWINIRKSKQKKEVEEEEEYSTWVSMPTRVYWGTSRRRSVTPCFTSSNAVFGSILSEKEFQITVPLFILKILWFFFFVRGLRDIQKALSCTRRTKRKPKNKYFIFALSFGPFERWTVKQKDRSTFLVW